MKPCRECQHQVSEQATACPGCGAPFPARDKWDGWGFEYKSGTTFLGLPLLHISFKSFEYDTLEPDAQTRAAQFKHQGITAYIKYLELHVTY